jgi:hypothetical protein
MYMYITKFTEAVSTLPSWAILKVNCKNAAILAPFELCYGARLFLYIHSRDELSFNLTDDGRTAYHVSHKGVVLTEELIHELNNTHGIKYAQVNARGEIIAEHRDFNLLHKAVEDAAKLALAMVFRCPN